MLAPRGQDGGLQEGRKNGQKIEEAKNRLEVENRLGDSLFPPHIRSTGRDKGRGKPSLGNGGIGRMLENRKKATSKQPAPRGLVGFLKMLCVFLIEIRENIFFKIDQKSF